MPINYVIEEDYNYVFISYLNNICPEGAIFKSFSHYTEEQKQNCIYFEKPGATTVETSI